MLFSKTTMIGMIIRRGGKGIKTLMLAPWRNVTLSTSAASHHRLEQQPEDHLNPRHNTPFVIFDTAQNSKCRLTTKRKNVLTWYSCGPTVYDSAHIGHASSFIRQDVIRRIIESVDKQFTLIQVMGITDIDDKIIRRAIVTGREWKSVSKHYEREFLEDLKKINVLPPHVFSRVSDFIPEIIRFVEKLVENKLAYDVADGSVYFDTEKYGDKYGMFRQNTENEIPDDIPSSSDGKRSSRDFALWKGAKPGEPFWSSPWGTFKQGRPGWHIECSVMASHYFGPSLDLHTGGRDLIFPHHENEEAQCCAHFQSDQWASHWLHMGHLHFKGEAEKMSKSLGNTISIRDFLKEHSPDLLRLLCINAKYRKNLDYSADSLENARKIVKKLTTFLTDSSAILNGTKQVTISTNEGESSLWENLDTSKAALNKALLYDFDTPEALKIVTELISNFNRNYSISTSSSDVNSYQSVNFELVFAIRIFIQDFVNLVGLSLETNYNYNSSKSGTGPEDSRLENVINQFVQFREQVRSYSLAMEETDKERRRKLISDRKELLQACDKVRDEMLEENKVEIKDHGKNSTWMFTQ